MDSGPSEPTGLLLFPWMNSDDELRKHVRRMVQHMGVVQKTIAARIGMKASRFNKWLNKSEGWTAANVDHMDRYDAYLNELEKLAKVRPWKSGLAGDALPQNITEVTPPQPAAAAGEHPVKRRTSHPR